MEYTLRGDFPQAQQTANPIPPPLNLIAVFMAVATLLPFLLHLHQEYLAFLALGPGGTPSNVRGFLRVKALGLFALRDVYTPSRAGFASSDLLIEQSGRLPGELKESMEAIPRPSMNEQSGLAAKEVPALAVASKPKQAPPITCHHHAKPTQPDQAPAVLPRRRGPRPETRGIAPHRQVTQRGSPTSFSRTADALRELAGRHAGVLAVGTSCFEPHTVGLFVVKEETTPSDLREKHRINTAERTIDSFQHHSSLPSSESSSSSESSRTRRKSSDKRQKVKKHCGAEIAHVHPSDGSLHVVLASRDVDAVLAAAWGERHPLARGGWWERFVPEGFVMVYAPRDVGGEESLDEEVAVVMRIVEMGVEGFLRQETRERRI